jgi:hypothetical protein
VPGNRYPYRDLPLPAFSAQPGREGMPRLSVGAVAKALKSCWGQESSDPVKVAQRSYTSLSKMLMKRKGVMQL